MGILRIYLRKELRRMVRENIRFHTIGRIQDLPELSTGFALRNDGANQPE